jgi:hypothetical protein
MVLNPSQTRLEFLNRISVVRHSDLERDSNLIVKIFEDFDDFEDFGYFGYFKDFDDFDEDNLSTTNSRTDVKK